MRKRERALSAPAASLVLGVVGAAMVLTLGGCGQSGPLYLPEKDVSGVFDPAAGSVAAVAARPAGSMAADNRFTSG